MKITMLGTTGSGKTTYMAALFERMLFNSEHGHQIILKRSGEDFRSRLEEIARLSNYSFEELDRSFPDSTGQTTHFEFDVYRLGGKLGREKICDFEWIDYRGGLIDDILKIQSEQAERLDEEEIQSFAKQVLNSHSLLIFIDAEELCQHSSIYRIRKKTGADHISAVLNTIFYDNPNHELGLVLMISKIDSELLKEDRADGYQKSIEKTKKIYKNLIKLCQSSRGRWQIKLGLVGSVGVGNVETKSGNGSAISNKIIGDPDPLGVEYPLFMLMQVPIDRELDRKVNRLKSLSRFPIEKWSKEEREVNELMVNIKKLEEYRESIRQIHFKKLIDL